jgi:uncharacterized protein (TIGR03083 family)
MRSNVPVLLAFLRAVPDGAQDAVYRESRRATILCRMSRPSASSGTRSNSLHIGLAQAWSQWARIGAELTAQDWRRPTRCEPWHIAHLYAHHAMFPGVLAAPPRADVKAVPVDAALVLRGFNAPGGIAHAQAPAIAERALSKAVQHSPAELVERFAVTGPRAIAALRASDPAGPVAWVNYVVTLAEVVRIALLEATVHLLDVQRALDRRPDVSDIALRETALLLAETAPAVEFIESASGRAPAAPPLPVIR